MYFLRDFYSTSKETLEDLIEELKREKNYIDNVKEEEHLVLGEITVAIFIKIAAALVVALLKKTDAWDKLVNYLQKIFRIGKNKSAKPEKLKLVNFKFLHDVFLRILVKYKTSICINKY